MGKFSTFQIALDEQPQKLSDAIGRLDECTSAAEDNSKSYDDIKDEVHQILDDVKGDIEEIMENLQEAGGKSGDKVLVEGEDKKYADCISDIEAIVRGDENDDFDANDDGDEDDGDDDDEDENTGHDVGDGLEPVLDVVVEIVLPEYDEVIKKFKELNAKADDLPELLDNIKNVLETTGKMSDLEEKTEDATSLIADLKATVEDYSDNVFDSLVRDVQDFEQGIDDVKEALQTSRRLGKISAEQCDEMIDGIDETMEKYDI